MRRGLCGAGDVTGYASASTATECHVRARRRRDITRRPFDAARTGRAAERRTGSIVGNQIQRLRWVKRSRAWLAHMPLLNSNQPRMTSGAGPPKQLTFYFSKTNQGSNLSLYWRVAAGLALAGTAACGPHAHIPPVPVAVPAAVEATDSGATLARSLAPLLYVQRDEWFPLDRIVAVLNPDQRIIAYHLLWQDDVHGSWIPFTVPTDEEIIWVGYDATHAPTDIWTFWHGNVLHADWRDRGQVAVDVQWGKHGSLPHGIVESDLPAWKKLNLFYAFTWIGLPDIWLGDLTRRGPVCFCHGYSRYRDFSTQIRLGGRLDVVVRTEDPTDALTAVFGRPYSRKKQWP